MQALARQVDRDGRLVLPQLNGHPHIRVRAVDVGPVAELFAQLVDDRVLDALRGIALVRDLGARRRHLDGDRAVGRDVRGPVGAADPVVQGGRVGRREAIDHPEHAVCDPGPQADPVGIDERAGRPGPPARLVGVRHPQGVQLLYEHALEPTRRRQQEVRHAAS